MADMRVRLDMEKEVVILTLDSGPGNPLTAGLCEDFLDRLSEILESPARAVVVTGQGDIFSGGGDLTVLSEWSKWDSSRRVAYLEAGPQAVTRALVSFPLPVIAAVNGAATGAGMDLALACDLRVAASNASFVTAYSTVGLTPGDGAAWWLPRFVGLGRAIDLLIRSRPVPADEALKLGLVSSVCENSELITQAVETARGLVDRCVAETRWLVHEGLSESLDAHLKTAAQVTSKVAGSELHQQKVSSIAAKFVRSRSEE